MRKVINIAGNIAIRLSALFVVIVSGIFAGVVGALLTLTVVLLLALVLRKQNG